MLNGSDMKPIEQRVTSLELSKELESLGVPQESLFYWQQTLKGDFILVNKNDVMFCYVVEQIHWDQDRTKGEKVQIVVAANNVISAAQIAGENDGVHEIEKIVKIGPIINR